MTDIAADKKRLSTDSARTCSFCGRQWQSIDISPNLPRWRSAMVIDGHSSARPTVVGWTTSVHDVTEGAVPKNVAK